MSDEDALPGDVDAAIDKAFDDASASTAPTTEPATTAATDSPAPSGPPRDPTGRFSKVEPTEALPPEATADPSAAPPAEGQPETPPDAATDEAEATYPEFTYRAGGRDYNIPGSAVGEDGLYIPTAALSPVQRLLAEGQHAKDASRDFARRINEAKAAGQQELQYARTLLSKLNELRQGGPDAIADWFDNLDRNWPLMEANAKVELLEKQRQQFEAQRSEADQEREAEALVPQLKGVLTETLAEYAKRPDLTGVDTKGLFQRLSGRLFDQVFEEATEDDVAQGIAQRVGQIVVNYGVIEDEMQYEADVLRRAREAGKAAQVVGQQNAARIAESKAPPTVGAKKGASPAGGKSIPKFATAAEADAWAFGDHD